MTGVVHLACGNYKCVYGVVDKDTATYGICTCVPYPNRQDFVGIEKVKRARWAIHHLRKLVEKQQHEITHLSDRSYSK